jgi:hypothetical protein
MIEMNIYIRKLVLLLAIVLLPPIASAAEPLSETNAGWSVSSSFDAPPTEVTLLQLLTNPSPYNGRYVQVMGVLSVEFEDNRLYFSKEFYDVFYPQYAIDIRLPKKALAASRRFQGKYVMLQGTFVVASGPPGSGVMEVTSLRIAPQPRNIKAR